MLRAMHEEHPITAVFIQFLLARGIRIQSDLVDQFFDSSEKRLARILLLMAKFDEPEELERLIPEITEEALAQMIGAPRPRVSFFMNRFCELGLIEHDGRIRVRKALLDVILRDQLPGDNAAKPAIIDDPRRQLKPAKRSHASPRLTP